MSKISFHRFMSLTKRAFLFSLIFIGLHSKAFSQSNPAFLRATLTPFAYSMGSVQMLSVQAGLKGEAFLFKGRLVPEFSLSKSYLHSNIEESADNFSPYGEWRLGTRIGFHGSGQMRSLKCVDHYEQNGKSVMVFYEEEELLCNRLIGISGGLLKYKSSISNPYIKEFQSRGSEGISVLSLYAGINITRWIHGQFDYESGNTCLWDKYQMFYVYGVQGISHNRSNLVYSSSPAGLFDRAVYSDKLRGFSNQGFILGYEYGGFMKGFVGAFELAVLPGVEGRRMFFKCSASYAIGNKFNK